MISSFSDAERLVCVFHKFTQRNDVVGLGGRQFKIQSGVNYFLDSWGQFSRPRAVSEIDEMQKDVWPRKRPHPHDRSQKTAPDSGQCFLALLMKIFVNAVEGVVFW